MIRVLVALVIFAGFIPAPGQAEWVPGEGSYVFPPDVAESEACKQAERKAQEQAVGKVTGERVSSDDLLVCSDHRDQAGCSLNRSTWRTIDGYIRNIRNRRQSTIRVHDQFRECRVTLEADVVTASGRPDPSFDMSVKLNRKSFRSGETLQIKVQPSQPMYVTVFQWLPYENEDRQVSRIFPNRFDTNNYFTGPQTIPIKGRNSAYDLQIDFPERLRKKKRMVDEYLMIVGTRASTKFLPTYSLHEFQGRLLQIPRRDWHQIKRAYNIVRPE